MTLSSQSPTARAAPSDPAPVADDTSGGLAQGGLGGPEDELLESGQEEVFSRTEVESGSIEHHAGEDAATDGNMSSVDPSADDEA